MPVKAERTAMLETENWVAIAFLCFLGLLAYLGAHRKMIDAIDRRQARIKSELEQARRLREEAQALLGEFQRKGREAENEAQAIMAGAEDFVVRRTKMAETKIAQAETQAVADVRSAAAEAAVAAAEKILATSAKGKIAEDLLARGIAEIKQKFN
jgi:F-type H+-transporting ATPase subunit b